MKKITARKTKQKSSFPFKGYVGSNMIYLVILTGAVLIGFMMSGTQLPSQAPEGSPGAKDNTAVTVFPFQEGDEQKTQQLKTFGGVTGQPTPSTSPTP